MEGKKVAQSICDWIVRYAKILESDVEYDNYDSCSSTLYSFASVLQETIDEGVYGE